ncbi:hypothetical protein FVEN_g11578 [Fusarium venenatum]|uniref:DUF218 domain-containing protein n=1 Tax=Fusarium venenatum TaxID=56646 RepID=A0A2L2T973_9HYPO|nr:uncharacterized protein FVRRES_03956 [Fusarium venenatum]KAG8350258.1 hypothetical protein FVEN_g11578 [Fusarium venenatum]KAH7003072.1 hypothetical protein EDB82DRAFT_482544 [Fusarium venenatum]CEI67444.1 unnamed protein product [Fusarium venenatum]
MPSRIAEESNELTDSVNIVSRFLALEQIYSAKDLDKYLQTLQQTNNDASTDVIVLCASAILAIPEAVFEWAVQQQTCPESRTGNTILVLCGGIGPCTPFVYNAIKASKKCCQIFDEINGQPEGQILKTMAERFYRLDIDDKETSKAKDNGFNILVSDRSTDCGADALETRKVLDCHGTISLRSITVVQDPAMSSRTVSSFKAIYRDEEVLISSWPQTKADRASLQGGSQAGKCNRTRELWSMNKFLDRIMGDTGYTTSDLGEETKNNVDIPNEVEDAWSNIMEKNSLKVSY